MKLWLGNLLCELTDKYDQNPKTFVAPSSGALSFIWVKRGELKARLWMEDLRLIVYHEHSTEETMYYGSGVLAQRIITIGRRMESEYFDKCGNPLSLREYEDYLDNNPRI